MDHALEMLPEEIIPDTQPILSLTSLPQTSILFNQYYGACMLVYLWY